MKETRTINLNGQVFHIDNDAYNKLSNYLQDIELRLPNDEQKEVLSDLEARIAELLHTALFASKKQVVDMNMVNDVKQRIGSPSEFGENKRPKVKPQPSRQGCGRTFSIAMQILLVLIALPFIFILALIIFVMMVSIFGVGAGIASALPIFGAELFGNTWLAALAAISVILLVVLPIVMIINSIVTYMRTRRGPKARFWWITLTLWVLSIICASTLASHAFTRQGGVIAPIVNMAHMQEIGDLDMQTEVRTLDPFHAINITGSIEVNLTQGTEQQVQVTSALGTVLTDVRDGVLFISLAQPFIDDVQVDIVLPTITAIYAAGASEVNTMSPFQVDELNLQIVGASEADLHLNLQTLTISAMGASSIEITGTAQRAEATLTGASEMEAEKLLVQDMKVVCQGASEAEVNVQGILTAQATGASSILYVGQPKSLKEISAGASTIRRK